MNANSPPHTQGLDSTVSVFGYLCLCLNVFFFSALLAADQQAFNVLCREDYWVESLTAVWFFLAGLLLFVTARAERSLLRPLRLYSRRHGDGLCRRRRNQLGQRIFRFATPDFLMLLNEQQEFTVHNINYRTI